MRPAVDDDRPLRAERWRVEACIDLGDLIAHPGLLVCGDGP
jgi:hypothetical protein